MNEQEKAAYILGLKNAIFLIEEELNMVIIGHKGRPLLLRAAENALMNASQLIQDEIAMRDGTREKKEK